MVRKKGDPPAHQMGGKEERASQVGKARSEAERQEREGTGPPPTDIPGPSTQELLKRPKPPPSAEDITGPKSEKPRAGPAELEPEDKTRADVPDSPEEKLRRQPKDPLPERSDQ
jgi:hypothetical protein